MSLVEELFEAGVPFKKAGVVLADLAPSEAAQLSLFAETRAIKESPVTNLVLALNERFGIETVQIGRHTKAVNWQSRQEHISPLYTTQWSQLAVVKA